MKPLLIALLLASTTAGAFEAVRTEDRFSGAITVRAPGDKDAAQQGIVSFSPAVVIVATSQNGKTWNYTIRVTLAASTNVVGICDSMILLADGKRLSFPKGLTSVVRGPDSFIGISTFPVDKKGVTALQKASKVEGQFCNKEFDVSPDWKTTWNDLP